ncbi:DNA-binding transcriptional LysR family regulator [Fusobacterium sp. PH5-7]|uniref:LysR family transcriptional regulator n=1 Tax=Fusobacterium sp. PH5-7 TaxID=2940528 RepID=UPI002474C591|nr:LysR family transcriptional regulator [Fusobacterium sp. PH5-7]MDH6457969.1 DNA-binding transcriptional LysR family regulator [Fusobacterium sp. PH5-7]
MELRVLRYFLAVAKEESITAASETLHVTQPTLSRQLMELEEEFGKKLFIRGNRKITLTDEGILLRKRAEEIVELVEKTETEITASDEIINGDIYIGGGETDAMRIIAHIVKKLQEKYPQVKYHLFSGNADDVTERLDRGLLDFGVVIEPANIQKYDYLKLPATDTWGVLMRKDSPLAQNTVIKPKDLHNTPLLCSRQSMVGKGISQWIGKDFEKLNIVATYNLVYNASLMVEEGIGYALSLDKLVNTTGNSALCFKPLEPKLEVGLNIVWKKSQVFSKAAKKFLEMLESELS